MSVVWESTRKMIPRYYLLVIVVILGWFEGTTGAAYSNVVVQRDGVIPLEYFTYDTAPIIGNTKAALLSTSPLESIVQSPPVPGIVTPCLAPCIISNAGSQLAPITSTSNAKIITINPAVPNIPVVTTSKETARGYQYAYAVYDDHTGDKKSQSEQSDGSAVQGQYSFIQPDGFRREVVYTADDLKGFNAIVRHILPEPEQTKESKVDEIKPQQAPCPEPQNAQLTQTQKEIIEGGGRNNKVPEIENIEEPKRVRKIEEKEAINPNEEKADKSVPRGKEAVEAVESSVPVLTNVISYNDIIKCLQAKLISANSAVSPLTYILIPSLKGPC